MLIVFFLGLAAMLFSLWLLIISVIGREGRSDIPFIQRMSEPRAQIDFDFVFVAIAELFEQACQKASSVLQFLSEKLKTIFHKAP